MESTIHGPLPEKHCLKVLKLKKINKYFRGNPTSLFIWLLKEILCPESTSLHFNSNHNNIFRVLIQTHGFSNQVQSCWSNIFWSKLVDIKIIKIKICRISMILSVILPHVFFWFSENKLVIFFFPRGEETKKKSVLEPKALFAVKIANVCLEQICENLQFVVGVEVCYFSQWKNCSV